MYPRQGVRSTGLSRTAGPGPAAPGHVLTTQAHTHLSQQSQATSLAHLNPTESVLTLTSTFAQGCLTPSAARAKHRARSALQKLSLGIRAGESLCFGDLAETNQPTNQKKKKGRNWFYSKAAGVQGLTLSGLRVLSHPSTRGHSRSPYSGWGCSGLPGKGASCPRIPEVTSNKTKRVCFLSNSASSIRDKVLPASC